MEMVVEMEMEVVVVVVMVLLLLLLLLPPLGVWELMDLLDRFDRLR